MNVLILTRSALFFYFITAGPDLNHYLLLSTLIVSEEPFIEIYKRLDDHKLHLIIL